ncbi:transposase [Trebonia sp.]|uniref:IS66 family transposase n=1 Tax=Trebonia sp. TaxID=2767075 RepID=UPI00260816E2|nr:transposase [Trebonia sp.]
MTLRRLPAERDAEIAALRAERDADREAMRCLGLRLEELERRLRQDSSDSGTPASQEGIAARERRKAERADPDRGRRKDRRPGGQPGREGRGLARDPSPGKREKAPPAAECRRCKAGLDGAEPAPGSWAQVIDVLFAVVTTEWELPGRRCPCCGEVTVAPAPPGAHAGSVSCGPALNAAAVVLTAHANVPPEKAARVIAMLPGVPVPAGWAGKAASRLAARLRKAGFGEAMEAALAAGGALAADETPVNVLERAAAPVQPGGRDDDEAGPGEEGKAPAGAPHILAVRTLGERLTWLRAIASRRKGHVTGGIPARFRGVLVTDGYKAYQGLLSRIAGIRQCCQHVIRRCRAALRPGPGSLQSWAADVITVLREAHQAVQNARARHAATPPLTRSYSTACGIATTRPPHSGPSTAGSVTGTRATTPAAPSPAGCRTSGSRSSCSPATSP